MMRDEHMIVNALKKLGPCLSTDLTDYLVKNFSLTSTAARKRVSRAPAEVKRLGHIRFQRNARFLYLQGGYASPWYWEKLYKAIYATKGAYACALGAVDARDILPIDHFRIACGAPIAQKKHISADTVLERLVSAGVLVTRPLPGLGECVLDKRTSEALTSSERNLVAIARSRLIAENILLDCIKEWLRRLALGSYNSFKVRTGGKDLAPKVGTFAWDLTAPSYVAGLVTRGKNKEKPGFIVCDVFLNKKALPQHVDPFLYKVKSLQALKKVGRTMFIFMAQSYENDAFNALRTAGVVPATPELLFGKDIAEAFRDLIGALTNAAMGSLDPIKFDELFNKLGKLEGAVGNMRGAFFELLVAEIIRKTSPTQIQLNKICKGTNGTAEVDVWELKEGIIARMIECKGMAPGAQVDDKEVELWLIERITRVRQYLSKQGWQNPKPSFELWTSGILSSTAKDRIEKTRRANVAKYDLVVIGPEKLREKAKAVNDLPLQKVLEQHFLPLGQCDTAH
jgi:hypothetical protein